MRELFRNGVVSVITALSVFGGLMLSGCGARANHPDCFTIQEIEFDDTQGKEHKIAYIDGYKPGSKVRVVNGRVFAC